MERIRKRVKCNMCFNFLHAPIRLPCNKSICSKHINEFSTNSNKFKCNYCNDLHEIPENGFKIDEQLNEILVNNEHLTKQEKELNGNIETQFENVTKVLAQLKNNSSLLPSLIYEKVADLRSEIDLDVEQLQKRIFDIRDKLFQQIKDFQTQCSEAIEMVDFNEIEHKAINHANDWKIEKYSTQVQPRIELEYDLVVLLKEAEQSVRDLKDIEESFKQIKYISNESDLNTANKSDQFLGEFNILKLEFGNLIFF